METLRWRIAIVALAAGSFGSATLSAAEPVVVIPFDLQSRFDQGRYGRKVGRLLLARLEKRGGVVLPEAMLSVRDTCRRIGFEPGPETPLEKVGSVVREHFGARVAIWGGIERVEGHARDVYDLKLRATDFGQAGEPRLLASLDVRTRAVSEIPHRHVPALLDRLYASNLFGGIAPDKDGGESGDSRPPRAREPAIEVVFASDFEQAGSNDSNGGVARRVPAGWESLGGPQNRPLGDKVRWVREASGDKHRVLRLQFDQATGDSTGVMYYSRPFPVEQGATYRVRFRWRTGGPRPIVLIKGYATVAGAEQITQTGTPPPNETRRNLREVYRSQHRPSGKPGTWHQHTAEFRPRHNRFEPFTARVMLYAYQGAGWVEFDDVVVERLRDREQSD